MKKKKEPAHCYLDRVLSQEEIERARSFLRQQGIYLPDEQKIAHIGKEGAREDCPYRYGVGEWTKYCANQCHLVEVLSEPKKKKKG